MMIILPPTLPESFPEPDIIEGEMRRVNVRLEGRIKPAVALEADGLCYEIRKTLKEAIFGKVVLAVVLAPFVEDVAMGRKAPANLFVRTEELRAIKIHSCETLLKLQGTTQEDPLIEIAALQFIGDSHPNIMGQIACCMDASGNKIYSIMRYCPGGELFDFIDERGPLEVPLARSMFRQLLNGLLHLQELGIGHRDMSLENMLFDGVDRFVIIDFGMCLRLKKDLATGEFHDLLDRGICVCGKPNYIAPEVMRKDAQFNPMLCDIWAAGVILFIALTGVAPMTTATPDDEQFRMICDGRLQELLNGWGMEVDPGAVDLIRCILNPIPQVSYALSSHRVAFHPSPLIAAMLSSCVYFIRIVLRSSKSCSTPGSTWARGGPVRW
jgi:serine/threonine protein kinase